MQTLNFRLNNGSDYMTTNNNWEYFPEGIDIFSIKLPSGIDNPLKFLYTIGLSIKMLNPRMDEGDVRAYLDSVCAIKRVIPNKINNLLLIKTVDNIFNNYDSEDILEPNTTRKFLFNENSMINKREVMNKTIGNIRVEMTKQRIYDLIEGWNKDYKITQVVVAKELGINERTVRRYWGEFKSLVNDVNNGFKTPKSTVAKSNIENNTPTPTEKDMPVESIKMDEPIVVEPIVVEEPVLIETVVEEQPQTDKEWLESLDEVEEIVEVEDGLTINGHYDDEDDFLSSINGVKTLSYSEQQLKFGTVQVPIEEETIIEEVNPNPIYSDGIFNLYNFAYSGVSSEDVFKIMDQTQTAYVTPTQLKSCLSEMKSNKKYDDYNGVENIDTISNLIKEIA